MNNKIDRPIFIVGTGRCGSTALNKILSEHPNLSFLTTASVIFPSHIKLQKLVLNLWNKPILGNLLRIRLIAGEAWPFWDQYIAGFSRIYRDFTAEDITAYQKQELRKQIPKLLSKQRHRLLIKFTGWTRVGFIKEVFPDAKIIHIARDPRAVINSMLHITFWSGRMGPYLLNWGGLTEEEKIIWEKYNQSFISLSAIEYKKIMSAFYNSLQSLPQALKGDVLNLQYSNLCENPESEIDKVLSFCDLEKDSKFMEFVSNYKLINQNNKWKTYLTISQQQQLENISHELNLTQYYDC